MATPRTSAAAHRLGHHAGVAGVEPAGDVGGGHASRGRLVVAGSPAVVALTEVRVQVDASGAPIGPVSQGRAGQAVVACVLHDDPAAVGDLAVPDRPAPAGPRGRSRSGSADRPPPPRPRRSRRRPAARRSASGRPRPARTARPASPATKRPPSARPRASKRRSARMTSRQGTRNDSRDHSSQATTPHRLSSCQATASASSSTAGPTCGPRLGSDAREQRPPPLAGARADRVAAPGQGQVPRPGPGLRAAPATPGPEQRPDRRERVGGDEPPGDEVPQALVDLARRAAGGRRRARTGSRPPRRGAPPSTSAAAPTGGLGRRSRPAGPPSSSHPRSSRGRQRERGGGRRRGEAPRRTPSPASAASGRGVSRPQATSPERHSSSSHCGW